MQQQQKKKKKSSKTIELTLEGKTHGFTHDELNQLIKHEARMVANDAKETERIDAKNALEEFVYDLRSKLQDGPLTSYSLESEREQICHHLNEVENWLYEGGEDCERDVYVNKMKSIQHRVEPMRERAYEFENCPKAFDDLKMAIYNGRHVYSEFKKGMPKYEHLTEAEFLNVSEAIDKAQRFLDSKMPLLMQSSRTNDCPVKVNEIVQELRSLNNIVNNVVNRSKPKPAAATNNNNNNTNKADKTSANGSEQQNGGADDSQQSHSIPQTADENTMDVE